MDDVDKGCASKEVKISWIKDLTSGEYPQAQGTLKSSEGFCCLGVFLAGRGYELETRDRDDDEFLYEGPKCLYDECKRLVGDFMHTGIEMNDDGKTFQQIAAAAIHFYNIEESEL